MTEEQKKVMKPRDVLEVLMPVETLHMQVHETRTIEINGRLKPSEGIRGIGVLIIAPDFQSIEVIGKYCNHWHLNTVTHAEYDEVEDVLYITFAFHN